MPGVDKPDLQAVPQIKGRLSFIYLERCAVSREDSAITATDVRGTVCLPAAAVSVIMLGPGTTITHRAVELLGDVGASIVWVGERGVRYYAHGRPLTHSSALLEAQARAVSNIRLRLAVARQMYEMRFPGEDVSHLTMQQLRGREGSRIRSVYRACSKETGVPWDGRRYDPGNYAGSDAVNQALSAANSCLYGVVHSVIVSLGCSPGLGFVHTGHERAFVYDVADLYKAEVTIPLAFRMAGEHPENVGAATRRAVRDAISGAHVLERSVHDIKTLLTGTDEDVAEEDGTDVLCLWDCGHRVVKGGVSYADETEQK